MRNYCFLVPCLLLRYTRIKGGFHNIVDKEETQLRNFWFFFSTKYPFINGYLTCNLLCTEKNPSRPLFHFTKLCFYYFFILHFGFPLYWNLISYSNIIDRSFEFVIKLCQIQTTSEIMTKPGWSPHFPFDGDIRDELGAFDLLCSKRQFWHTQRSSRLTMDMGKNLASHSVNTWCECCLIKGGWLTNNTFKILPLYSCNVLKPWLWIGALLCC